MGTGRCSLSATSQESDGIWGCDGCLEPLPLPYTVLAGGKEAIKAYLSSLPPRKKRFGSERKRRPQK
jgi:hypothetical protein